MNCTSCGDERDDVEVRHSFGVYAGRLCLACCSNYRDNCGEGDVPMGTTADLEEPLEPDYGYGEGPGDWL